MLPNNAWRAGLRSDPTPPPRSTSFEYEFQSRTVSFHRLATPPRRSQPEDPWCESDLSDTESDLSDIEDHSCFGIRVLYSFFCTAHAVFRLSLRILWTFGTAAHAIFRSFLHFLWTFASTVGGILLQPIRVTAQSLAGPLFLFAFTTSVVLFFSPTIFRLAPRGAANVLGLPAAHLPEPLTIRIEPMDRLQHVEAVLSRLSLDLERLECTRNQGEGEARGYAGRLRRLEDALSGLSLHYERARSERAAEASLNAELVGNIAALQAQVKDQSVRAQKAEIAFHAATSSELKSLRTDLEALQLFAKAFRLQLDVDRPDFALHSGGASVIPSLTSPTYTLRPSRLPGRIFGYLTGNGVIAGRPPVTALHYDIHNGHCWPFAGSQGQLGIVLAAPVRIEEITIDHVAAAAAVSRRMSAPRDMEVWAMVEGQVNVAKLEAWRVETTRWREPEPGRPKMLSKFPEYIRIASFQYDLHSTNNIQTFPVDTEIRSLGMDFGVVVLLVKSNWGMDEYTCLYRIRVHGQTMMDATIL